MLEIRRNSLPNSDAAKNAANWMLHLPVKSRSRPPAGANHSSSALYASSVELLEDDEISLEDFEAEATEVHHGLENTAFENNLSFSASMAKQHSTDNLLVNDNSFSDNAVITAIKEAVDGIGKKLAELDNRFVELHELHNVLEQLQLYFRVSTTIIHPRFLNKLSIPPFLRTKLVVSPIPSL